MSLQSALEQLATYRTKNTRASQDVFRKGLLVLQKKGLNKLGDDGKSFHYTCYNVAHKLLRRSCRLDIPRTTNLGLDRCRTTRHSRCMLRLCSTYLSQQL